MKIKVVKEKIIKEIDHCARECPFFELSGCPGPIMECCHPSIPKKQEGDGYIISHPECDTGFPDKCPLTKALKGKKLKEYNRERNSLKENKQKLNEPWKTEYIKIDLN